VAELQYGIAKSTYHEKNLSALYNFLSPLKVFPFDAAQAKVYGHIRATLEKKGTPIGGNDLLIAAHALSIERILVTNNTKEFQRVEGLSIENWAATS